MIVNNLGSMWFVCLLQPGFFLIFAFVNFCLFRNRALRFFPCWLRCRKRYKPKLDEYFKNLFWNNLIKFVDQQYEILCVMCMIGFTSLRLDSSYTAGEIYCSWFVLIVFPILLIYPFFMAALYYCKIGRAVPLPDLDDRM
jgi:hypothetical protein